jgi:hypothetical protein
VNLTYQRTTFLLAFIQRGMEIQMMLKNIFFDVAFLLRLVFYFVRGFEIDSLTIPRCFVLSLPLLHLLRRSKNKNLMMDQLGRSRRQLHKRRRRRVLWQVSSIWKARLLRGQSHMRQRWYHHFICVMFGNIGVYSSFLTCTTLRSGLKYSTTLASGRSITLSLITSNPTVLAATSRIPIFF